RYWGEPIPIIHCEKCGMVGVPEEDLPVKLPKVDNYKPTETGESPLALIDEWKNTTCPKCGGKAVRETDTMPQWAGSSWYFLRYIDPKNDNCFADEEKLKYWLPIDWYNGGMEHVSRHLIYSRFWHRFLYDMGYVPEPEPYKKRTAQGLVLGSDGEKMSKSRGNVVNPKDIIREYGADTLRTYIMFIGDYEKPAPWSDNGVKGCKRFLDRVWKMQEMVEEGAEYDKELEVGVHQTIKKVTSDYEALKFNTAIAQLMTLTNDILAKGSLTKKTLESFLLLLNPVAPHMTEEMWEQCNLGGQLHEHGWPSYEEEKTVEDVIEMAVQVNGKVRGKIRIPKDASQEQAKEAAMEEGSIQAHLEGKQIVKEIFVAGRIYNIVAK
ncbi:MAG TPA: leucine--tRNA ligase, partial [Eubacteriaceae bacterium]|nr:leucine--tRNA ligase [Eubacteriaceae bacterium]